MEKLLFILCGLERDIFVVVVVVVIPGITK